MATRLSRRRLLQGLALAAAGTTLPSALRAAPVSTPAFAGATVDAQGRHATTVCDSRANLLWQQPLPDRGHALALHPNGRWLAQCSRRPGSYLKLFERRTGRPVATIDAAAGRYFNGHCLFGERLLYATETVAESGDGCIGIYDGAADWRRVGEWNSGGLDPHDLRWSADGLLVVANGGLLSHPETPGIKLNIATMDSNLTYLDSRNGRVVAQPRLAAELHQLSLRHLAIGRQGEVAVAMQWEGASMQQVPLVALHRDSQSELETLALPASLLRSLRHYCGSAAVDTQGRLLAVSSPVGGTTVIWDLETHELAGELRLADGCGVAAAPAGGFVLSSGRGELRHWSRDGVAQLEAISGLHWDNHLLSLPA